MRILASLAMVALVLAASAPVQARSPRRRTFDARIQPHYGVARSGVPAPLDPRAVYPKYYGGFHARTLQNIGVPTGDIGIRGNGIYANPW
jgi:hypothetical protein